MKAILVCYEQVFNGELLRDSYVRYIDNDDEKIETTANKAHMWGKLEDAKVVIYPTEKSVVEIVDEETVNDNTEFV